MTAHELNELFHKYNIGNVVLTKEENYVYVEWEDDEGHISSDDDMKYNISINVDGAAEYEGIPDPNEVVIDSIKFESTLWQFPATESNDDTGIHLYTETNLCGDTIIKDNVELYTETAINMIMHPEKHQVFLLRKFADGIAFITEKFGHIFKKYDYKLISNDVFLKNGCECTSENTLYYDYDENSWCGIWFTQNPLDGEIYIKLEIDKDHTDYGNRFVEHNIKDLDPEVLENQIAARVKKYAYRIDDEEKLKLLDEWRN